MNNIKNKIKEVPLFKPIIIIWRKFKLLLFSYFNLPKKVLVPLDTEDNYIILNTRDWVSANFVKNKLDSKNILNHEPNQRKIFNLISSKSKVVFDVGAHIGYFSILAAKNGANKVFSFEIDDEFIKIAKKQALLNKVNNKIKFVNKPIGLNGDFVRVKNYTGSYSKKSFSIDYFCKNKNIWPNLLKIDIEGFELEAFQGATELLKRDLIIILELHPQLIKKRGKSYKEIFKKLYKNNFLLISLGPDNIGEEIKKGSKIKMKTQSLVCIKKGNNLFDKIKPSLKNLKINNL